MILLLALSMLAGASEYVLVVNGDVPDNQMSSREMRRMLSKQNCCWSDGLEAALILPPNSDDAMSWLSREFIGLEPDIFRRYLMERCYRLGCTPMIGVTDLQTAHDVARRTPGAITLAISGQIPEGLRELPIKE